MVFGRRGRNGSLEDVAKNAAPHLVDMLRHSEPDVRQAAETTFGQLVQHDLFRESAKTRVPQLVEMFKDSNSDIRRVAAVVFRQLIQYGDFCNFIAHAHRNIDGLRNLWPIILERLCYDPSEEVARPAASIIGQFVDHGHIFSSFVNVALYSLQELHTPNSTLRTCAASIWITLASYASLRPTLYELTAIFGGILYFEPDTPLRDVRAIVERMIGYGMLRIHHEDL
ncbi:hypothetical protein CPB86DRAFT_269285 [Serendipita vermifera]|nr:hypothetical protein CPB86DRAFT_269285 [Serendipita vermifera]